MKSLINFHSYSNLNKYLDDICNDLFQKYESSISVRGEFNLVLSGGNSPNKVFNYLISVFFKKIKWNLVNFYWVDERFVDKRSLKSNYCNARNILKPIFEIAKSVNPLVYNINRDLNFNILNYNKLISEVVFDYVMLGMGEDGHVASIFPGSYELNLKENMVTATKEKYHQTYRLTFTLSLINKIKNKILIISNNSNKVNKLLLGKSPINSVKNIKVFILNSNN